MYGPDACRSTLGRLSPATGAARFSGFKLRQMSLWSTHFLPLSRIQLVIMQRTLMSFRGSTTSRVPRPTSRQVPPPLLSLHQHVRTQRHYIATLKVQATQQASSAPAALESDEGFRLPLEPGQLIGFKAGQPYRDSELNQHYDELLSIPLEPGYSQSTAAGRAEVLDMVRTMIITSKGRPQDQRPKEVLIPYDLLPGTLSLLAELCHNELVMHLGTELLATGELEPFPSLKHDVLLSMALAKCNMARDEFAQKQQVAAGCKHLEEALQLLQPKGAQPIAPDLTRDIKSSLAELHSQYALEQVSGPILKETLDDRKRAVRTIRDLLKQTDADLAALKTPPGTKPAQPINQEFVQRVMQQLTLDEVVFLMEWENVARQAHACKWLYPGLLERVAAGQILLGFLQCQPQYVKMAAQVLKHVPNTPDTLVTQAICQLLLGSVQGAADLLRQAEVAGARNPRYASGDAQRQPIWGGQALKYVKDNTPAGEDGLLPGLVRYAEMWLRDYASPQFRDTAQRPPQTALTRYFDDVHVEALLGVYDEKGQGAGPLKGLVEGLARMKDTVQARLGSPEPGSVSPQPEGLASNPASASKLLPLAAIGLVALGGAFLFSRRGEPAALTADAPTAIVAAPARHPPIVDASAELTPKVAEQVLRLWQEIKAAALGPSYDASELSTVLCEPVLSETRVKVAKFKSEGWYMKYKLRRIKVRSITHSAAATATVTATLDEGAVLYDVDGQETDSYKSMYDAQYDIIKGRDNVWRVSKFTVLSPDAGK